jgi:hypothetical protein
LELKATEGGFSRLGIIMVKKECYGILEKVFPVGENGLREVVPECFECPDRVACLKTALSTKEGFEMRAEVLERASASGMISRLRQWSQKKELSRLMKQEKAKKK